MKNWTVGRRIVLGFVLVIGGSAGFGLFTVAQLAVVNRDETTLVRDVLPGVERIQEVRSLLQESHSTLLWHVLSSTSAKRKTIEQKLDEITQKTDREVKAYQATIRTTKQRELFDATVTALGDYRSARDRMLTYSRQGREAEAYDLFETTLVPALDRLLSAINADVDVNKTAAATAGDDIVTTVRTTRLGILVLLLAGTLTGAIIAVVIVTNMKTTLSQSFDKLAQGARQLASMASQVSDLAQSLSQGATEQAASLEETSASMEEMASMTRTNAENAEQAATLVIGVSRQVTESNVALKGMVGSIAAIKESSDKVAKIINTIDEIAFQTNILALNAAVEAARAGEEGMGFAVVADEVRNLAQRSAQAAKDTAGLIEASIARSQEGAGKVQEVATAIAAITESVTKVKEIVDEVRGASRQQALGIDQVSLAIAQMEKVTQTTAATAEESAAASEELNAQAETSMSIVGQLEALVGGSGGGSDGAVAACAPAKRRPRRAPDRRRGGRTGEVEGVAA